MRDYMLAVMLEPRVVGTDFGRWPLHITLVPWFRTQLPLSELLQFIDSICASHSAGKVLVGKTAMFGPNQDIPVNLIDQPGILHSLHSAFVQQLQELGAVFLSPHNLFISENYNPHITRQSKAAVNPGFTIGIKQVYVMSAPHKEHQDLRLKKVEHIGVLHNGR